MKADVEGAIVPDDPQLSCLPFDSAGNVENHLAQLVVTFERLAPDMNGPECVRLLRELALLRTCLERIEYGIRSRVTQQAKRLGISA